jgi:hypothetical protein
VDLTQWLTIEQAAQAIGSTRWRLYRVVSNDPTIPRRRIGNVILIRLADLARKAVA